MKRKPCNDCPFLKATPLAGSPDWLRDVMEVGRRNPFFTHSCHKTDPQACGYVGKKSRECAGHLRMIFNDLDKTPGLGGVYDNRDQLIETYLISWLGEKEFNSYKRRAAEVRR